MGVTVKYGGQSANASPDSTGSGTVLAPMWKKPRELQDPVSGLAQPGLL